MHEQQVTGRIFKVKEASVYLGIAPGTLYHFVSEKRIPVTRIRGRCIRFRERDLERWLDERTRPASGKAL
jgi:excisionase family DNA binding protein